MRAAIPVTLLLHGLAMAQVAPLSPEVRDAITGQYEAILKGAAPPNASVTARPVIPDDVPNPRNDARDFRGVWSVRMVPPVGGMGAASPSAMPSRTPGPRITTEIEAPVLCIPDAGSVLGQAIIYQTQQEITLIMQNKLRVRRIYLDREFPAKLTPSYAGYSVGRWEGDTLVVRTRALKGPLSLEDDPARPGQGMRVLVLATPTLQVTERWRRINNGSGLEVQMQFEDPATGMQPYTTTTRFSYHPAAEFSENLCDESARVFAQEGE